MSASWNVLKPSGEDVFSIEPGMPDFDYGRPTVFFNASSTASTTFFSNIPCLGAGGEFKVAYVAKEGGAPSFTVAVPCNNNVVLATLESGKIATIKIARDCDTWYCSQDCFEVSVEDFDESAVNVVAVVEPVVVDEKPTVCCEGAACASECPSTSCLCITVVQVDGTTVNLCASSVVVKGKGINVSLTA